MTTMSIFGQFARASHGRPPPLRQQVSRNSNLSRASVSTQASPPAHTPAPCAHGLTLTQARPVPRAEGEGPGRAPPNLCPLMLGRLGRAPTAAAGGGRHRPRCCRWPRPMELAGSGRPWPTPCPLILGHLGAVSGRLGRSPIAAARRGRQWPRTCRFHGPTELVGSGRAPTAATGGDHRGLRTRR